MEDQTIQVEGKVIAFDYDKDGNEWSLITTELENGNIILYALYQKALYDISSHFKDLSGDAHIVFIFSPQNTVEFILQKGTQSVT